MNRSRCAWCGQAAGQDSRGGCKSCGASAEISSTSGWVTVGLDHPTLGLIRVGFGDGLIRIRGVHIRAIELDVTAIFHHDVKLIPDLY